MSFTTISIGYAKKIALQEPVVITSHGKPAHVLLNIKEYQRIIGKKKNIVELLAMQKEIDVEFKSIKLSDSIFQSADLS